ncbi:DsrE/F-like protein domain-containing protein [Desulfonema limicola]|uniref:DsrE/F-like protein domain-containing protein n=1 Tax=Desulfonema limicola TaxID=45656 RepID=A0A975BC69_9BACT|nr:DsrE family protein [Desulfonema limicola]QTA82570.1 DsrE/F-like protein domain-containing protein [Desulfonema limicola]
MEQKQEKILYIGTCAGENPEKACMPFVMALAAQAMDVKATIALQGNGVYLALKGYVDTMLPGGGFPPIKKLITDFLELGGELKICMPCIKERNIAETDLIEGSEITAGGALNLAAIEADAVLVY